MRNANAAGNSRVKQSKAMVVVAHTYIPYNNWTYFMAAYKYRM